MSVEPLIVVAMIAVAVALLPRILGAGRAPPELVREKLERGATIVDVRTAREFSAGAYPGAVNIPLDELGPRASSIPRDRAVVLYCASGARSRLAAGRLRKSGFTDVVNAGGMRDLPPAR